jgi:hypothetical protein
MRILTSLKNNEKQSTLNFTLFNGPSIGFISDKKQLNMPFSGLRMRIAAHCVAPFALFLLT